MTLVREVLERDPIEWSIPNDGVAKVGPPETPEEWNVLNYELRAFVVEGEYEAGLERILRSYTSHLGENSQPAAWVSGFFGSGKSHLLKALAALWNDLEFPGGARATGLVKLPQSISDQLAELKTRGAQFGGRFAAAGTLDAGASSAALAILSVVFAAAGLPTTYPAARLVLWLKKDSLEAGVTKYLSEQGRTLDGELLDMYVSDHLARAVLAAKPDYAATPAEVRNKFEVAFPPAQDLDRAVFLDVLEEALKVTNGGQIPLTILVLDELQLFLNEDPSKTWEMQQLVEGMCAKFGSRLLVVGAGQMALRATPNLQRLQDRFTVEVPLRDADVSRVVRSVVLKKKPTAEAQVAEVLERSKGEISRQFAGSAIQATAEDAALLVSDYPLLPTRRRLWEAIVRAVDTGGRSTKLRTQLRDVLDATKGVAERDLGAVVAIDAIYDQKRDELLGTPTLPRETDELIEDLDDGTEAGQLKSRIAKVVYLLGRLPRDGVRPTGVHATDEVLIDALVTDLRSDRAALDPRVRAAVAALVKDAVLSSVDGEYRLRNRVDAEWQADLDGHRKTLEADKAWIAGRRTDVLKAAIDGALKGVRAVQGASKVKRDFRLFYGDAEPKPQENEVPVWVQSGWETTEKLVMERAHSAGVTDATVFVFIPRALDVELSEAIVTAEAADRTVNRKAAPTTEEGVAARAGVATRRDLASQTIQNLAGDVLHGYRVVSAGGAEVSEPAANPTLIGSVARAIDNAVLRLYPDFSMADSADWAKVVDLAGKGNPSPLSPLHHVGDVDNHPVVKAVLSELAPTGTRGQEIRKLFEAPGYGWSRDAIDGSLLALTVAGKVEARHNGTVVTVKAIPQNIIGNVEFRPQTQLISMTERLAVRPLAQKLGHKVAGVDDMELPHKILQSLLDLAQNAGGNPPLPPRPDSEMVRDLEVRAGNDQFKAIAAARGALESLIDSWKALASLSPSRLAAWEVAQRLSRYAAWLAIHDPSAATLTAIETGRTLLADPDPVTAVLNNLMDALRAEVIARAGEYDSARARAIDGLRNQQDWLDLADDAQKAILRDVGLDGAVAPLVGTADELLRTLDVTPLSGWAHKIQAVPTQASEALARAAKIKPVIVVEIPHQSTVIHDEPELTAYLERVRNTVAPLLAENKTVIL
jgi:hypothetical protein